MYIICLYVYCILCVHTLCALVQDNYNTVSPVKRFITDDCEVTANGFLRYYHALNSIK